MRTTSVFINRLSENGFPFAGKIKFTLMSTDPDFLSNRKPVSAFFINGKAKVQLIPNIFISKNVSTYYHYEIFAQHPVNAPIEVEFELIEEGDCIVPIKPSCLQEILIPAQQGIEPEPSGSDCNCEEHPLCVVTGYDLPENSYYSGDYFDNLTDEDITKLKVEGIAVILIPPPDPSSPHSLCAIPSLFKNTLEVGNDINK